MRKCSGEGRWYDTHHDEHDDEEMFHPFEHGASFHPAQAPCLAQGEMIVRGAEPTRGPAPQVTRPQPGHPSSSWVNKSFEPNRLGSVSRPDQAPGGCRLCGKVRTECLDTPYTVVYFRVSRLARRRGGMLMSTMTIGQLSKKTGVGVETIRFYERQGLMPEAPRRSSGYREYDEDAAKRLRFIRESKRLGFSLEEIEGLLSLTVEPSTSCGEVSQLVRAKIADITERIEMLKRMKDALAELDARCQGTDSMGSCGILAALEGRSS